MSDTAPSGSEYSTAWAAARNASSAADDLAFKALHNLTRYRIALDRLLRRAEEFDADPTVHDLRGWLEGLTSVEPELWK